MYPGHGKDTTLGTERLSIPQWRARGYGAAVDIEGPGGGRRALLVTLAVAHLAWAGMLCYLLVVSYALTAWGGPAFPTPRDLLAIALAVATVLAAALILGDRLVVWERAKWFVVGMSVLNAALATMLIVSAVSYEDDTLQEDPSLASQPTDAPSLAAGRASAACAVWADLMLLVPEGTADASHPFLEVATKYADDAQKIDGSWTDLHEALVALPPRIRSSPNDVGDGFERVTEECRRTTNFGGR